MPLSIQPSCLDGQRPLVMPDPKHPGIGHDPELDPPPTVPPAEAPSEAPTAPVPPAPPAPPLPPLQTT